MRKGFTLMELLIGMTLFGVVMATANVLLFTSLRSARKAAATGVTKTEGSYAMNAMVGMIKYSRRAACSTGTRLDLVLANGGQLAYELNGDTIASVSGSRRINLTSPRVRVSTRQDCGLRMFTCTGENQVSLCFRVEAADSTDTSDSEQVDFNSRVTLRNFSN